MGKITFFSEKKTFLLWSKKASGKRFLLVVTLFLLFLNDMLITDYSGVKNKI